MTTTTTNTDGASGGLSLKAVNDRAKSFAKEHLIECAAELLEWSRTALLRDGRVRELAVMLEPLDMHNPLALAEAIVKHAALERVAAASAQATTTTIADAQSEYLDPTDIQGWSVTVNVNARDILTIGHNSLSGIARIEDFAPVVRNCAEHLLSFIGTPEDVQSGERADCVHVYDPKGCYRVRCQLGNKCVDDDMSPRAAHAVSTAASTPTLTDEVLMRAIADTAGRGHTWASRALSEYRARMREVESGQ
ncbi:hypothetical protein [Paraburkholderia antibiotica]|uniref:Uncharacterized protein n=1 Tax=Paraburkholderia antibiotica TaxID=2728839 RepID=A0A7Y0A1P9_9BURK|nr:hypothetical protein [Paraburkholderia antibiotica]NML34883.1 hypothetical protein [Paraburkholderia antibiotica]